MNLSIIIKEVWSGQEEVSYYIVHFYQGSSIFITNTLWLGKNISIVLQAWPLDTPPLFLYSQLKSISLIVSVLHQPHVLHLSPGVRTVKCYFSSGTVFTEAWRPHTAHRDPEMRVNKPGEPSLTPRVVTAQRRLKGKVGPARFYALLKLCVTSRSDAVH